MIDLQYLDMYWAAKQYVDAQLAVMEKYGSKPALSRTEYEGLVVDVLETTLRLRGEHRATLDAPQDTSACDCYKHERGVCDVCRGGSKT